METHKRASVGPRVKSVAHVSNETSDQVTNIQCVLVQKCMISPRTNENHQHIT